MFVLQHKYVKIQSDSALASGCCDMQFRTGCLGLKHRLNTIDGNGEGCSHPNDQEVWETESGRVLAENEFDAF